MPPPQIRSSYRKKVLLLHPDRNKNSPDKALKFLEVQEAWDVLGNNDARASYDNFLDKCQNPGLVAEQDALLKQELAAMHREQEEADKAAGWNFGRPATGGGGGSRYGFFGSKRNK
jgi:DnaJ family protein C protein 17